MRKRGALSQDRSSLATRRGRANFQQKIMRDGGRRREKNARKFFGFCTRESTSVSEMHWFAPPRNRSVRCGFKLPFARCVRLVVKILRIFFEKHLNFVHFLRRGRDSVRRLILPSQKLPHDPRPMKTSGLAFSKTRLHAKKSRSLAILRGRKISLRFSNPSREQSHLLTPLRIRK